MERSALRVVAFACPVSVRPSQRCEDGRNDAPPCHAGRPAPDGSLRAARRAVAIRGTLLTPEKVIENGAVVIEGDTISAAGPAAAVPDGAKITEVQGYVLPGFIDLHNHLTWNMFPRWNPERSFATRYDWQDTADYDRLMKTPQSRLMERGLGCDMDLYAEVKALAGGATSSVGSLGSSNDCIRGLIRNLDFRSDLGFAPAPGDPCRALNPPGFAELGEFVVNDVFPLERPHGRIDYLRCELEKGNLKGLLVHIAEGNPLNASARREFPMLKAQSLIGPGLGIIHGSALRPEDFAHMKEKGAGLIWSPRSNDELYGGTANIPAAQQAGVLMAIAPDWSPTGSAGMLQELSYTASRYGYLKPEQLIAMATSAPARIVRLHDRFGRLAPGLRADLIVVGNESWKTEAADLAANPGLPFERVVKASPADIRLAIVGGVPVYGDRGLLRGLLPDKTLDELTVCGAPKAVDLSGGSAPSPERSWQKITERLSVELRRYGITLAEFECD